MILARWRCVWCGRWTLTFGAKMRHVPRCPRHPYAHVAKAICDQNRETSVERGEFRDGREAFACGCPGGCPGRKVPCGTAAGDPRGPRLGGDAEGHCPV